MEMWFTICYKGFILISMKIKIDTKLYNTSVSITCKWSHSEPGEEHVQIFSELCVSEDQWLEQREPALDEVF